MKTLLFALLLAPIGLLAQTINVPTIPVAPNPAVPGGLIIPATAIPVTPAPPPPVAAPMTHAAFLTLAPTLTIAAIDYKAGVHEVTAFNAGGLANYRVQFQPYDFYDSWSHSFRPKFAIVTVPFKIRPAIRDTIPAKAIADLKNVGISTNIYNLKLDRYLWNGTKTSHRFTAGILLAPSVEEVGPATSDNKVTKASNQMFLSAGLSLSYSYGDMSFVLIPIGTDIGLTRLAQKSIYNMKPWFGFGIGLSSKFF